MHCPRFLQPKDIQGFKYAALTLSVFLSVSLQIEVACGQFPRPNRADRRGESSRIRHELSDLMPPKFEMGDINGDGLINPEELEQYYKDRESARGAATIQRRAKMAFMVVDRDKDGAISESEHAQVVQVASKYVDQGKSGKIVGLQIGNNAPDFELKSHDGSSKTKLSELWKEKPTVLFFGSLSSELGAIRSGRTIQKLVDDFSDVAEIRIVYVQEHFTRESRRRAYARKGITEHKSLDDRCAMAKRLIEKHDLTVECLIDDINGSVSEAFRAYPHRMILIRTDGRIAMMSRKTNLIIHMADELREWLNQYEKSGVEPPLPKTAATAE